MYLANQNEGNYEVDDEEEEEEEECMEEEVEDEREKELRNNSKEPHETQMICATSKPSSLPVTLSTSSHSICLSSSNEIVKKVESSSSMGSSNIASSHSSPITFTHQKDLSCQPVYTSSSFTYAIPQINNNPAMHTQSCSATGGGSMQSPSTGVVIPNSSPVTVTYSMALSPNRKISGKNSPVTIFSSYPSVVPRQSTPQLIIPSHLSNTTGASTIPISQNVCGSTYLGKPVVVSSSSIDVEKYKMRTGGGSPNNDASQNKSSEAISSSQKDMNQNIGTSTL